MAALDKDFTDLVPHTNTAWHKILTTAANREKAGAVTDHMTAGKLSHRC